MATNVPKMLTAREVAEILKVSYDTALNFMKYADIDCLKIGNQYRVSEEALAAFLRKKGKTIVNISGLP